MAAAEAGRARPDPSNRPVQRHSGHAQPPLVEELSGNAARLVMLQRMAGNRAASGVVAHLAVQRETAEELAAKFMDAVNKDKWQEAAVFLNGFSDEDIQKQIKPLNHVQHVHLYFGAVNALTGVSRNRITKWLGTYGEFRNEITQHMTEGATTVVQGHFVWTLIDGQLEVYAPVQFVPDSGVTVPLATWQTQIDGVWNKFAVVEPGGRKVPITMKLWNDPGHSRKIKVVENNVPGTHAYPDRANAGKWYPVMPPDTAPHEFGHLIGLPDEYQRTHGDFKAITGTDKTGPANNSGRSATSIAASLHSALYLDDQTKRAAAATKVLTDVGLIVGGKPQQGDFAQEVMARYDKLYGSIFTKYLLEALQDKLPAGSNWTLLTVFSYASGTIMGNAAEVGAGHDHPVEPRHLREFRDIVAKVWPEFTWTIGNK